MKAWLKRHLNWVLGLLLIICIFLLYSWINALVSLDYARQEEKYQRENVQLLQSLLQETGKKMSQSEIRQLVKSRFGKEHIIKEQQNQISVDNIILKFNGNSLVEIKLLDD